MENVIIETWNKSSKGLTLPAGTYIIGYRAGGTFLNEIYISYSMSIMTYIISYLIDMLRVIVGGGNFFSSLQR